MLYFLQNVVLEKCSNTSWQVINLCMFNFIEVHDQKYSLLIRRQLYGVSNWQKFKKTETWLNDFWFVFTVFILTTKFDYCARMKQTTEKSGMFQRNGKENLIKFTFKSWSVTTLLYVEHIFKNSVFSVISLHMILFQ